MGDVKLNIAGRIYDVHCEDGQEQQLIGLAAIVGKKYGEHCREEDRADDG